MSDLDLSLRPDPPEQAPPAPRQEAVAARTVDGTSRPSLIHFGEFALALAWFYDGLFCKLFDRCAEDLAANAVLPSPLFSWLPMWRYALGGVELLLALWIVSRAAPRLAALAQTTLIGLGTAAAFSTGASDPGHAVIRGAVALALVWMVARR